MRTSVLLATYNRRDLLPAVLRPLLADPAADEVLVVVDGGRDGSLELLQEMSRAEPRLRAHYVDNGGAARALTEGARRATGDLLVIVDDDEIAAEGTIAGHARHHVGRDDLVLVGYVEMTFPPRRRPGDFSRYVYAEQYDSDCRRWESDPSTILTNLWGGFLSMTRANYLRVMDGATRFVDGYHYDLDFGARCLELGLTADFDRTLRARHLYARTATAYRRDAYSSGRNRILVHAAHPTVLPSLTPGFVDRGIPAPGRVALRLVDRWPRLTEMVVAATRVAGEMRLWELENMGAGLLWAIEQKRGAREAYATLSAAAAEPAAGVAQKSPGASDGD